MSTRQEDAKGGAGDADPDVLLTDQLRRELFEIMYNHPHGHLHDETRSLFATKLKAYAAACGGRADPSDALFSIVAPSFGVHLSEVQNTLDSNNDGDDMNTNHLRSIALPLALTVNSMCLPVKDLGKLLLLNSKTTAKSIYEAAAALARDDDAKGSPGGGGGGSGGGIVGTSSFSFIDIADTEERAVAASDGPMHSANAAGLNLAAGPMQDTDTSNEEVSEYVWRSLCIHNWRNPEAPPRLDTAAKALEYDGNSSKANYEKIFRILTPLGLGGRSQPPVDLNSYSFMFCLFNYDSDMLCCEVIQGNEALRLLTDGTSGWVDLAEPVILEEYPTYEAAMTMTNEDHSEPAEYHRAVECASTLHVLLQPDGKSRFLGQVGEYDAMDMFGWYKDEGIGEFRCTLAQNGVYADRRNLVISVDVPRQFLFEKLRLKPTYMTDTVFEHPNLELVPYNIEVEQRLRCQILRMDDGKCQKCVTAVLLEATDCSLASSACEMVEDVLGKENVTLAHLLPHI